MELFPNLVKNYSKLLLIAWGGGKLENYFFSLELWSKKFLFWEVHIQLGLSIESLKFNSKVLPILGLKRTG